MIGSLADLLGGLWLALAGLSQASEGGDRGQEMDPNG
jgi:hypothetical protein